MSPNEQKMTSGRAAIANGLVDHLERRHAYRTAGPVDQRDLPRQHFVQAEPHDGVRLAAADLHHVPRPGRDLRRSPGAAPHGVGVAVLVDVFHDGDSGGGNPVGSGGLQFRQLADLLDVREDLLGLAVRPRG